MPQEQFFNYIMAGISYIQWDDKDVCFVLDKHALSWIFIVLVHWTNQWVDMSLHLDTLTYDLPNSRGAC
jgi:hypothetical protein